jgi:hypothetical protein
MLTEFLNTLETAKPLDLLDFIHGFDAFPDKVPPLVKAGILLHVEIFFILNKHMENRKIFVNQ